jgi:hypothetical protein
MAFKGDYLTARETEIWRLRKTTRNQSKIGRILGISRQAVNISLNVITDKIDKTFKEALNTNNLIPSKINLVDGVVEAYSPAYRLPVILSLSAVNGLKVWYLYEGNCARCDLERKCRRTLMDEAKERGVELEQGDDRLEPTKLALKIFSRYLSEDYRVE